MYEGIRFSVYKKGLSFSYFYGYIKELFNLKLSKYKKLFNMLSQSCMESNSSQYWWLTDSTISDLSNQYI